MTIINTTTTTATNSTTNSADTDYASTIINLLNTKRNLLYIRILSVPRSKNIPPWL